MSKGKRNRTAGHNWERELAEMFRKNGFPHTVTSRSESYSRDAAKIDLINHEEVKHGQLPFSVQAKNMKGHVAYAKFLSELPVEDDKINVIMHKQTVKRGNRFIPLENYAIMKLDDFFTLVKLLHAGKDVTTDTIKWMRNT